MFVALVFTISRSVTSVVCRALAPAVVSFVLLAKQWMGIIPFYFIFLIFYFYLFINSIDYNHLRIFIYYVDFQWYLWFYSNATLLPLNISPRDLIVLFRWMTNRVYWMDVFQSSFFFLKNFFFYFFFYCVFLSVFAACTHLTELYRVVLFLW